MLKSSDIIFPLEVLDGALSESEVTIVTLSFLDDVITYYLHYFDPKCIGKFSKVKILKYIYR